LTRDKVKVRLERLLAEPLVAALMRDLNPPGEETRIIGGAVRNAVIGTPVSDVDFGTTMAPDQTSRCAEAAGWHVVPTGIEHGTVTLIRDHSAFEVTTLRQDIETDGRHARVLFGRDFRADAARRDFTMNALALARDGAIYDYFEGLKDIAARRVRFIGDPDQRLREDYLRGLRFLRFSAAYGGGALEQFGLSAVIRQRHGFALLSRERVRQEMLKLLEAEHAYPVIRVAEEYGLVSEILGLKVAPTDFATRLSLGTRAGETNVPVLARLAALAVQDADSIPILRENLRLTNTEERWLTRLVEAHQRYRREGLSALLLLGPEGAEIGAEAMRREVVLRHNLALLLDMERVQNPPVFHLSGKDIVACGIAPGPEISRLLDITKTAWARHGFPVGEAEQRALMIECIRSERY
jgi:poly(A) polymerase